jgi:hypothetical protein
MIIVVVKCCVIFVVWTEFLKIIQKFFALNALKY